jgi:hypothetical protein
VLDMAANTLDLGKLVAERIAPRITEYGLELPVFYVENISLPHEVEVALDKRTKMGIVGDLAAYGQFSAAEAITAAANNPGGDSGMGAGLGIGMGMSMANSLARSGAPAAQGSATVPPPPPLDKVWHLAISGETRGPFSRAELGQMAARGDFTRQTHVWTPGQDGWKRANDIAELAQLFTVQPPPPPHD